MFGHPNFRVRSAELWSSVGTKLGTKLYPQVYAQVWISYQQGVNKSVDNLSTGYQQVVDKGVDKCGELSPG